MTTNRFQPGDKVRVKSSSAAVLGLTTHATHTVAHVDDFGQLALRGGSSYYHPSHFELVMRAVADESYCLKDGEGDWWVYTTEDPAAEGYWYLVNDPAMTRDGSELGAQGIIEVWGVDDTPAAAPETYCLKDGEGDWWVSDDTEGLFQQAGYPHSQRRSAGYVESTYGIDAEPIPAVAEGPLRAGPGQIFYAPLVDAEPEVDQRISAWDKIADHPIFKDCYPEERPLIDAMMAKLDRIYSEGASPAASTGNSTGPHLRFETGDRVEVVDPSGDGIGNCTRGDQGTVVAVELSTVDLEHLLRVNLDNGKQTAMYARRFRKVEPDPALLQPGDWVKVLARVEQVFDNGSVRTQTFQSDGAPNGPRGFAIASAITRTDEVPEWARERSPRDRIATLIADMGRADQSSERIADEILAQWDVTERHTEVTER